MESQKLEPIAIDSPNLQQLPDYESEKLNLKVINSQRLQQLQEDINKEIRQLLKNSNLSQTLKKYGLSGQKILKVQCSLDITQFISGDSSKGDQTENNSSVENTEIGQKIIEFSMGGFCYPCLGIDLQPDPDYPDGCWVD